MDHRSIALALLLSVTASHAAPLALRIEPMHQDRPLALDGLRYRDAGGATFSVTRLSMLLSEFELRDEAGAWHALTTQDAFIDTRSGRLGTALGELPEGGPWTALRFHAGPPPDRNHAQPAGLAADHPLNPLLNRLHWEWKTGYIFVALEGRINWQREQQGYVFHLANDPNRVAVEIPLNLQHTSGTLLHLRFDVASLFHGPNPVSFATHGASTHSHENDPLAARLRDNLPRAFRLHRIQQVAAQAVPIRKPPAFLPKTITPWPLTIGGTFPLPDLPGDNPLITERVTLGKTLFHDTRLSRDNSVSCATCHEKKHAFTDALAVSNGIEGGRTQRNSMPLFNLAWKNQFFWDGRSPSLRDQALKPIEDPAEMGHDLDTLLEFLRNDPAYQGAFTAAFGKEGATRETLGMALEAFQLTLTSHDSRFDRAARGEGKLTAEEQRGMQLFFGEYEPRSRQYGADCFHCHGGPLFGDQQFHDNGISDESGDTGFGGFTERESDHYKFATPSLRNVALTGPYMHDGRFATLEEVIDHYAGPMPKRPTLDANLAKHPATGLPLSTEDRAALVAFLQTLTDPQYGATP